MKINIIDESERQQSEAYIKGFGKGVENTMRNIVKLKENGVSLKRIYKIIKIKLNGGIYNDAYLNHKH